MRLMAQVSLAFSHPSPEYKPSLPGVGHTRGLGSACRRRQALEAASGAQGGAGEPATMREKQGGLTGRCVQRACCPSWNQGRRETHRVVGVEMREVQVMGQGKVLVCPHPPLHLFPRLHRVLQVLTELPATSLFLASIFPSTGHKEQLSSPPALPCASRFQGAWVGHRP